MTRRYLSFFILALTVLLFSCGNEDKKFVLLAPDETGVTFSNDIFESDTLNVLRFEYIYNGGGVGVADFNQDGLQDIFFAGNMVSSKLYLNRKQFKFSDVTQEAGTATTSWCTGVSIVDINNDGFPDIHVSTIHPHRLKKASNLFFLNKGVNSNGVPVFEEVAGKLGIADTSYSTQAAFLDYDKDGDLDMYLLNNGLENFNRNTPYGQRHDGSGKSMDKFFRNEGPGEGGLPVFRNVSREAGILSEGWGLGIVVNDFNHDLYPDIYVANDFLSNDFLYINQRDGTFRNEIASALKHQEHNGMGVDVADINNDGYNDIIVMDMMPDDNLRQKTMFANTGYDRFHLNLQRKYQTQYIRNVLQLNNGNGSFSDIAFMTGVYATDWSWSSLMADFDNDGLRDILITNGYRKDITDLDFVAYSQESGMFGTDEIREKNAVERIKKLQGVKKPNFIFRNDGDLRFTNVAEAWGLDQPSYSNGTAYADFDNDGDLDLVMNNINDKAFILKNTTVEKTEDGGAGFLRFRLAGNAVGTKLYVYTHGAVRFAEHQLQRGYKSTMEPVEHFGMGNAKSADSVVIIWPSGNKMIMKNVAVNKVYDLEEKDSGLKYTPAPAKPGMLDEVSSDFGINFKHNETDYADFKQQPLLPHKHSQGGPGVAVGDVNGDGLEDFIIGGAAGKPATLFVQNSSGKFSIDTLLRKPQEDMGVLLFDADNDGDLDLYCVSGSSELPNTGDNYQDRLYRNDGTGRFTLDPEALPAITRSGSCVTAADFDKDGDLDLFTGGRIVPGKYPLTPKSLLLRNNGKGVFEDVTQTVAKELESAGMVTSALFTDVDNDGWQDLLVTGEWMPIVYFRNNNGAFSKADAGLEPESTTGWWNSLSGSDPDRDGDTDYVAGNLGYNSIFQASPEKPVRLYAKDFDDNSSVDPIITRYIYDKEYITHPRDNLTEQIPGVKKEVPKYSIYGKKTFSEIIVEKRLKNATIYTSTNFATSLIENNGDAKLILKPLPNMVQVSPTFGTLFADINGDGKDDLITIGNSYASETLNGWYDAGIGCVLTGNGAGKFSPVPVTQSGFFVDRDAKALVRLNTPGGDLYLATQNRDSLKVYKVAAAKTPAVIKPEPLDTHADLAFTDGKKQKVEFYYGSGYLSHSSRTLVVPTGVTEVTVYNSVNKPRKIQVKDGTFASAVH